MLDDYQNVWLVDAEFQSPRGECPIPICVVFRNFRTKEIRQIWCGGKSQSSDQPPHFGQKDLAVSYFWTAESRCFRALGWPQPARVLDLFTEFRNLRNGLRDINGYGLLDALKYFNLSTIPDYHKAEMRNLAMRGGPYSFEEQDALLKYCQSDVDALDVLLPKLEPYLHPVFSILRGRFMGDVAAMEDHGIPIDVETLKKLRGNLRVIREKLIDSLKPEYDLYEGTTFKTQKFETFLREKRIRWPRIESGRLASDDNTFKQMAIAYPSLIKPLRDLRKSLNQLHNFDLPVGGDGRNRCMLSPFRSKTGRNQPRSSEFIFGQTAWLRSLIKPVPGTAIAHIDWSQQEFGIAAALSGDPAMQAAYSSGDPYLTFAKQSGAVPASATKQSHPIERSQYKICSLGVQYGQSADSLAISLGDSPIAAGQLLKRHKATYPKYWRWSDSGVNLALEQRYLQTVYGWTIQFKTPVNERSVANFPCQANGAEILRAACRKIRDAGIRLLATVHDAILIEANLEDIDDAVTLSQSLMQEAGQEVLCGFKLRSEAEIFRYPNRYQDPRGKDFWSRMIKILANLPSP